MFSHLSFIWMLKINHIIIKYSQMISKSIAVLLLLTTAVYTADLYQRVIHSTDP